MEVVQIYKKDWHSIGNKTASAEQRECSRDKGLGAKGLGAEHKDMVSTYLSLRFIADSLQPKFNPVSGWIEGG